MQSPDYKDNPEHYKELIAKINEEANFPMYLHRNGYALTKKSAGSTEFQNKEDRIVLQTARSPITYFNRNDSSDKGLFFTYLLQRSPNFYKAIQWGLEIINSTSLSDVIPMDIKKPKGPTISLEENYNIVPLRNSSYLRIHRGISQATLNSVAFKGHIFNAYHIKDNGGKIPNIAFPKYDLDGKAKNYMLYNKPYQSKTDNKTKKFRLVLNKKDQCLFYSKAVKNPTKVIFAESGIDLLSYHELHGRPDNFYVSFDGNVYCEKLQFFIQLIQPLLETRKVELVSIMDNDSSGHRYDLKISAALINQYNPNVGVKVFFRSEQVCLYINYAEKVRSQIQNHLAILKEKLSSGIKQDSSVIGRVKCTGFSDRLLLEFSLQEVVNTYQVDQGSHALKTLLDTINALYVPFPVSIHKSQGKDWNDDLRATKVTNYVKMDTVDYKALSIGDKIELNTAMGPEGSKNIGSIKSIKPNSVECDFGLRYTYAIPLSAIKTHLKQGIYKPTELGEVKLNTSNKSNNFENHIL